MITDYTHFDYNKSFLHNYNIFTNNKNVGIGTFNPKELLDIHGNVYMNNNINILGNLNLIKNNIHNTNILQYLPTTNQIKPINLVSYISQENTNKYEWTDENHNLSLKIYDKRDNISYNYQSRSLFIKPINNVVTVTLFLKSDVKLTHIYIYKKSDKSYIDLKNIKLNNIGVTNIKDNYYYKLNTLITLNNNTNNTINITAFPNNDEYCILFIGYYDFISGTLWNSNIYPNENLYIHNNISILTNNSHSYQLYVKGSLLNDKTIDINRKITTNTTNVKGDVLNEGYTYIYSKLLTDKNKLYINSYNQKVSIGTTKKTELCNIGDETTINEVGIVKTNNIKFDQIEVKNKIGSNRASINFKQHDILLNHIFINKPSNLKTKLSDTIIYIKNNININDKKVKNTKHFNINGNINVTNNIYINDTKSILLDNVSGIQMNNVTCNILKNKHTTNVLSYFTTKNLQNNKLNVKTITLPTSSSNNKVGTIYYDSESNLYKGVLNRGHITFEIPKPVDYSNNHKSVLSNFLLTNVKNVLTKNIKVNKPITLPKKNNYNDSYYDSFNKSKTGVIQFNTTSLYMEVFNGYKWNSIKYENSDSEIKNIVIDNDKSYLIPLYNPRIFYYKCNKANPTKIYFINSPYHTITIKKNANEVFKNENTTIHFIPLTYTLTDTQSIIIESSHNNNNSIKLSYTIIFSN